MISRIKKLLESINIKNEAWFGSVNSSWKSDSQLVDVFKNPSRHELSKITNGLKNPLRFIIDLDGNVYMWDGNSALHDEVSRQLEIPYQVKGAYYKPTYVEFFKTKTPNRVYDLVNRSYLLKLVDDDYKDNLLRRELSNSEASKDTVHYNNWRFPTVEEIKQEYKWEYLNNWKQTNYFKTFSEFNKAILNSTIITVNSRNIYSIYNATPDIENIEELKELVSGYRFPRDVDRIVGGFKNNDPIPMPIIIKKDNNLTLLSGNTRLTTAHMLGIPIKAVIVDVSKNDK